MTLDQAVEDSLAWLTEADPTPGTGAQSDAERVAAVGLTPRELQVVALVARGMTNRQIGEELFVTEGTAENYVQRVLGKLGVNNRAQAAVWAHQRGVGTTQH